MSEKFDLLIRAGRIVCPLQGWDAPGSVGVRAGQIAAVGRAVAGPSDRVLDFSSAILLPGLIDMHAHPARSLSKWGIDPDDHFLTRGTTTVLSQGDAGAGNCEAYVRETIERSRTRVLLAINLSTIGESGPAGCFERLDRIDIEACVAAIARFRGHIWGISVNASRQCCGRTDPKEVLRRGLAVAAETGRPILYGLRCPEDWPIEDQLPLLRPGDVVTYCYRSRPHCIVEKGRVLPCVRQARARGILFDVGHGQASFDFDVAKAAMDDGFAPDTISTDLQRGHLGQTPVHDLPRVMSKLRAAGMPERDVFAAVTRRPAQLLERSEEIGSLRVGGLADLTLLESKAESWATVATIRAGQMAVSHTP